MLRAVSVIVDGFCESFASVARFEGLDMTRVYGVRPYCRCTPPPVPLDIGIRQYTLKRRACNRIA